MGSATRLKDANVATEANFASSKLGIVTITERDVAEDVAAALAVYGLPQICFAARRTLPTVKSWVNGSRAPNSASLMNMARVLPRVRALVYARIEAGAASPAEMNVTAVISGLQEMAAKSGKDGAQARAILAAITRATQNG